MSEIAIYKETHETIVLEIKSSGLKVILL